MSATSSSIDSRLIKSLQKENKMLKQKNSILDKHFEQTKSKHECLKSDYQFQKEKYNATIADLKQQIHDIKHSEINLLKDQIKELTETNKKYLSEKDEYMNNIQKSNLKILQREQEIKQLKLQNLATNCVLNDTQHKLTELNMNLNDKNKRIDGLTQEIKLKTLSNTSTKRMKWNHSTIHINNTTSIFTMSPNERASFIYAASSTDIYDSTQPVLMKRNKSDPCYYSNSPTISVTQLKLINNDSDQNINSLKKYPTNMNTRRYSTIQNGSELYEIDDEQD
eukprot:749956_1